MKKIYRKHSSLFYSFVMLMGISMMSLSSCGNSAKTEEAKETDDEAFYKTQPVHSGLYDADYYDITGPNARKGRFDGRIYFSLSPDQSIFYVYENGNRTKIDYVVGLQKPFEKGDSGIYYSTDMKDRPVSVSTDSTMYTLQFQQSGDDIKVVFNPKARHTGNALEILERMNAQKKKNN